MPPAVIRARVCNVEVHNKCRVRLGCDLLQICQHHS